MAAPSSIPDTMSISGPGLPSIVSQPDAQSNPGTSDLFPSLDKTLNLVQLFLDPQLSYSSIPDAMPILGPGLPCIFFLARSPI